MAQYTAINNNGDPVTQTAVDTGVGSAPYNRPSVFTPPPGAIPTLSPTIDTGVGSTVAKDAQVFEPPSVVAVVDPGLTATG